MREITVEQVEITETLSFEKMNSFENKKSKRCEKYLKILENSTDLK